MELKTAGLYVHVPFCVRKCGYCDFLSAPSDERTRDQYVRALVLEIESYRNSEIGKDGPIAVPTVFFGGGTPSLLSGGQMAAVMAALRELGGIFRLLPNAEITMEANPGTVTPETLAAYRRAGINRLSFGLQSADERELKRLGRIHTFLQFSENYHAAREAGFHNINVDLMSALPGQTAESWERTLRKVLRLNPEHISAYSLIVEEGTPFYERYGTEARDVQSGPPADDALPDEDTERRMYVRTKEILDRAGYSRYEISNYAKPGYVCRHNRSYWKRIPYLGLGLGAASFFGETRWRNEEALGEYLRLTAERAAPLRPEQLRREIEVLERCDQMAETMFLGLRMTEGVSEQEFAERFGVTAEAVYGEVFTRQEALGLILRREGRIRLTEYGVDVSNQVFYEYLP